MPKPLLGLVAAMPEEIAPFLKKNPTAISRRLGNLPFYVLEKEGCTIHLIEAGMGPTNGASATSLLLTAGRPELLASIGFCGAISSGEVGDLVVATALYLLDNQGLHPQTEPSAPSNRQLIPQLEQALRPTKFACHAGTFITTPVSIAKELLRQRLPAGIAVPVLEMESSAIARIAAAEGIPFIGIRTVSDGANEELGFDITDFTDDSLRIKPGKVLCTVLKRPQLIPQLLRLARNARTAGASLASALTTLTEEYYA